MPKTKPERKISIIGCFDGPYSDPDEFSGRELWTCNNCWSGSMDDVTRWYEIHPREDRPGRSDFYWSLLERHSDKVWTFFDATCPGANIVPWAELLAWAPRRYFTSSLAWMIAQAIYEGVSSIEVRGLEFASVAERWYERPCVEWWLGYAQGKGIEVISKADSSLLQGDSLYGLQQVLPMYKHLWSWLGAQMALRDA